MIARVRAALAWLIGLRCGMYGGGARWCQKRFGHIDSCMYDDGVLQPKMAERLAAKGYR